MKELTNKTFGETPEKFKRRLAFALQQEERTMRKKLSVGLVLAIVLMLVTVSVLAAVLLSGKDFVQEVLRPKAQEGEPRLGQNDAADAERRLHDHGR